MGYVRPRLAAAAQFHRKSQALQVFSGGGTAGSGQVRVARQPSICWTVWPNDCKACCTAAALRLTSSKAFTGRVVGGGSPDNSFRKYRIAFEGAAPDF